MLISIYLFVELLTLQGDTTLHLCFVLLVPLFPFPVVTHYYRAVGSL